MKPVWSISRANDADTIDSEFASRQWARYHREQNHPAADYRSNRLVFVARDSSGELIGLATGKIKAGVGHLSELLVDTAFRGQGVGSALLEVFGERCKDENCHKLTVHTECDGPARDFYEHRNWIVEAIYHRDMAGLDYVRLMKFLDEDDQTQEGALER